MKGTFFVLCLGIGTVFFFSSCSKGNDDPNTNGTGTGGNGSTTPGPLFTAVKTMMATNCAVSGCHTGSSPASGLNFTSDNTIVAQKDRIKIRAVDQAGTANQMPQPPNPPLSATDQKKITDWVSAGGRLTD
jgi:hypothetical protein